MAGLLWALLSAGVAGAAEPALTVPAHLRPVVVPSPGADVPAYVLVEARFTRAVPAGDGLYLEFRPVTDDPADPRWHALWFRPCETNDLVTAFVAASLPAGEPVQIAVPVNPPDLLRRHLIANCQAGGYRTPAESESYATSLFASNLQTLRGEDAGIYLGGPLNSLVRLGRLRPTDGQNRSSISAETSTTAATTIHSAGGLTASVPSSSNADSTSSARSSS